MKIPEKALSRRGARRKRETDGLGMRDIRKLSFYIMRWG
jgi:hypothetical protein